MVDCYGDISNAEIVKNMFVASGCFSKTLHASKKSL